VINRILEGKPPIIYGDGHQTRDYIYVKDTAKMAIKMAELDDLKGETINVGSGVETSIIDLIRIIADAMGYVGDFDFQPPRPGDVRRHIANVFKAKDLLGFDNTMDFTEGMRTTVKWYMDENRKE